MQNPEKLPTTPHETLPQPTVNWAEPRRDVYRDEDGMATSIPPQQPDVPVDKIRPPAVHPFKPDYIPQATPEDTPSQQNPNI